MTRRGRIVVWSAMVLVIIIVVMAGLVVSFTQTDFGQGQVRILSNW